MSLVARSTPILLPCHGTSTRGVHADDVAATLAARGLVQVVEDIEEIVAAAREGRDVIALDGCAASCQARLLDARGVQTVRGLSLDDERERTEAVSSASSVAELEAASGPVRRSRRLAPAAAGELSARTTHSLEDYLLALDTLTAPVVACGAVADAPTVAAHVAQVLGVSRPAAGEMLGRLGHLGFVRRGQHKDVLLTPKGRAAADTALRRQRILERFAVDTLGYGIDECYERAREIAEGFIEETLERVWAVLGQPDRCPHGWPVDAKLARRESRGLLALSSVPSADVVEVERIDETSRQRVRALLDAGVAPGAALGEISVNSAAELVSFAAVEGGERRSISLALAGSALVRAA
jgi:DtxR family transcriptional regulator, Mn-dependent transcriptional regulator